MTAFDSQKFFEAATHYASKGRGLFRLENFPNVLTTLNDTMCNRGLLMLRDGLFASQITTGGSQIATHEPFSYSGVTRKAAHTQIFADMNIQFLLMGKTRDDARAIYHTFNMWHKMITGPYGSGAPVSEQTPFYVSYYSDYIAPTATVTVYSPTVTNNLDPIVMIKHNYYEIYPVGIGPLQLSWADADAPMALDVTFTFYYSESIIPT